MAPTTENQTETPASAGKPWLELIEDDRDGECSLHNEFIYMINDLLLSQEETTAANTAVRVDRFYEEVFLPNDPLTRIEEDKGMGPYLRVLWEALVDVAKMVPYDDPKQDRLVQFILEMRKLPPKPFIIDGIKTLLYVDEPVLPCVLEDRWNNAPASCHRERLSSAEYHSLCDKWVNYCAFTARCITAGISGFYRRKHSSWEIANGLGERIDTQPERDCKVMVAAQYILIAGPALREIFIDEPRRVGNDKRLAWGLENWSMWIDRLKGIEEKGDCAAKVLAAVVEAREKLIALHTPDATLETSQPVKVEAAHTDEVEATQVAESETPPPPAAKVEATQAGEFEPTQVAKLEETKTEGVEAIQAAELETPQVDAA